MAAAAPALDAPVRALAARADGNVVVLQEPSEGAPPGVVVSREGARIAAFASSDAGGAPLFDAAGPPWAAAEAADGRILGDRTHRAGAVRARRRPGTRRRAVAVRNPRRRRARGRARARHLRRERRGSVRGGRRVRGAARRGRRRRLLRRGRRGRAAGRRDRPRDAPPRRQHGRGARRRGARARVAHRRGGPGRLRAAALAAVRDCRGAGRRRRGPGARLARAAGVRRGALAGFCARGADASRPGRTGAWSGCGDLVNAEGAAGPPPSGRAPGSRPSRPTSGCSPARRGARPPTRTRTRRG